MIPAKDRIFWDIVADIKGAILQETAEVPEDEEEEYQAGTASIEESARIEAALEAGADPDRPM